MLSTCPNCLQQVSHEDHLFDVECACGTHFNPFNQPGDLPPLETTPPPQPSTPTMAFSNFKESNDCFKELRDFGESLTERKSPAAVPPKKELKPSAPQMPAQSPSTPEFAFTGEATSTEPSLMTSAGILPGYRVEQILQPVSLWADIGGSTDPLSGAFESLWLIAKNRGANGIIGLQWSLSGNRVLVSGTAVRCSKE
ncbi:MAG: hypothetical protein HY537_02960 [Deltaproteobacteria bacterium]|nr:hypothetical protein [Deltaproteobacteria bacterium]